MRTLRDNLNADFIHWLPRDSLVSLLTKYVCVLAIVAAASLIRYVAQPYLGRSGFAVTLVAMLLAAWSGGLAASLVGQTAILFIEALMFADENPSEPTSYGRAAIGIGVFYFVGIVVALLSEYAHAARVRAALTSRQASDERERLRVSLACMGDGVLLADERGLITLLNPMAEQMLGLTAAEALGRALDEIFAVSDECGESVSTEIAARVLRDHCEVHCSRPLLLGGRRASPLPVKYMAAPMRDARGKVLGVVLVVHDETERQRSEQQLLEADRRKDEFLATLAHELRNPLAPITMGLDLMKLALDDRELLAETCHTMERQTRHMVRLIDDLLDVSRITRGKLRLKRETVAVQDAVRNALEATRPAIERGQKHLRVDLPDEPCLVDADPHRLAQVITNLLDNAAKFTPPGGEVAIRLTSANGQVSLSVCDSGIGIPLAMQSCIFDMFTQVSGSLETGSKGLGIGLTLVKSLVEMHGGTITVHSDGENAGSQFTVQLPALQPVATRAELPSAQEAASEILPRRVLVVDDNLDALQTLARVMRKLGHQVFEAVDGEEAIVEARLKRPEIILMDIGMPRMNGYEAARAIRSEPWGSDIVLVATTGWGQEHDRQKSVAAGFDQHLVKPVELAAIEQILRPKQNLLVA